MHDIVPLILIIIILIIILCIQRRDHGKWSTRSARLEHDMVNEEEQLLYRDEGDIASPRQNNQPLLSTRGNTDSDVHLPTEVEHWESVSPKNGKEIEKAHKNIEQLQRELLTSASRNTELQRQCENLSRDLEGAQLFLNTADVHSDSEVIQMLRKLNAELQHTTTFMAEHVVSVFKFDATTLDLEQQIVITRASESLGSTLVKFLRSAERDDSEIPMFLQIAFQACLAYHLCQIVSSWTLDEGQNTCIKEIYQRMRETEKQAICGRWRSLARAYILHTCASEPNSFVIPIISGLSDILLASGCSDSRSHIMSELSSMFQDKISGTMSLAGRLNQIIGGVVSGDFEVFVVRPGEVFHGGIMEEDMDGSGDGVTQNGKGTAHGVLCTSELGLTKRVQLGTGEKESRTVMKAKVILESFLNNGGQ